MSQAPQPTELAKALGGVRGVVDSALAPGVFVLVRIVTHSLAAAIAASLAVGAVILGLRLARKESVQQAVGGFVGVALAAAVSGATGTGKGFFLPGIIMVGVTGVASLISLLVKRPFVGLALAAYDSRYAGWREDAALFRACMISTVVWTVSFFLRFGVASAVYSMKGDRDGLLLIVINLVKIPSFIIAAAVTYFLVKAAMPAEIEGDESAPLLDGGV